MGHNKPPYYLTAYGLAVKEGFKGTLAEWLASLHGDGVQLRYQEEKLQWRSIKGAEEPDPEEGWQDLLDVAGTRQAIFETAMNGANRAEEAAGRAEAAAGQIVVDQEFIETQVFSVEQAAEVAAAAARDAAQSEQNTKADAERAVGAADEAEAAKNRAEEVADNMGSLVSYDAQTVPEKKKAQARENIGVLTGYVHETSFEKYFDIDFDGKVSLKKEYRGLGNPNAPYSQSDNRLGYEGSKIAELPERLVIPQNIDGETVTGFQTGAFCENHKIKEVVIPPNITQIPGALFYGAIHLKKVENTEQIVSIGSSSFRMTSIEEIRFPNLTTLGNYVFKGCSLLRVIDIGKITAIPAGAFHCCEDLTDVLGGGNVKTIGVLAFFGTRRLKSLSFLANVTKVDGAAFAGSRCDFEEVYETMVANGCTFVNSEFGGSTYKQYNSTDYWSGVAYTACKNELNSLFHQKDPRWADHYIGPYDGTNGKPAYTYGSNGCALCTLAEIYSAFEKKHFDSPEEFVAMLDKDYPSWKNYDFRDRTQWSEIAKLLGYSVELISVGTADNPYGAKMTSADLANIYAKLASGSLAYRSVGVFDEETGGGNFLHYGGHATLCYGVNSKGEVLISDTCMHRCKLGVYENHKSAQPIYTHGSEYCDAVIVSKPNAN